MLKEKFVILHIKPYNKDISDHIQCYKSLSGSNMYLGDDGVKELVIICGHVHFSHKNEWSQDCFMSPKGAGPWQKTMWQQHRK